MLIIIAARDAGDAQRCKSSTLMIVVMIRLLKSLLFYICISSVPLDPAGHARDA